MKRIQLHLLFLILPLALLYGQEFRLVAFADYYGEIEASTPYDSLRNRYYLQPEVFTTLGDSGLELLLSANLWYQPVGEEEYSAPENILREAYLRLPLESMDIFLGQKFVTFGFADVFGPLNVVNGADTTVLSLDDRYNTRRPDPVIQLKYYPNFNDFLELVYVPFARPDYEPQGEVSMTSGDLDLAIDFENPAYITENPHSLFLRYYHMSDSFDLQLLYGWYVKQTPSFDFSNLTLSGSSLTGTAGTEYDRNQIIGAAFSTIIGNIAFAEDVAFNLTEDLEGADPGVKNSDITANTQLTGQAFNGALWQLSIIYQHILNYDAGSTVWSSSVDQDLKNEINDYYNQPVQNIAFAVGHLEKSYLRNKLLLALNGGFFFSTRFYLAPRASYALSDRLRLELGADIWTAEPTENDLMRQGDEDNFFVRLKYEY